MSRCSARAMHRGGPADPAPAARPAPSDGFLGLRLSNPTLAATAGPDAPIRASSDRPDLHSSDRSRAQAEHPDARSRRPAQTRRKASSAGPTCARVTGSSGSGRATRHSRATPAQTRRKASIVGPTRPRDGSPALTEWPDSSLATAGTRPAARARERHARWPRSRQGAITRRSRDLSTCGTRATRCRARRRRHRSSPATAWRRAGRGPRASRWRPGRRRSAPWRRT